MRARNRGASNAATYAETWHVNRMRTAIYMSRFHRAQRAQRCGDCRGATASVVVWHDVFCKTTAFGRTICDPLDGQMDPLVALVEGRTRVTGSNSRTVIRRHTVRGKRRRHPDAEDRQHARRVLRCTRATRSASDCASGTRSTDPGADPGAGLMAMRRVHGATSWFHFNGPQWVSLPLCSGLPDARATSVRAGPSNTPATGHARRAARGRVSLSQVPTEVFQRCLFPCLSLGDRVRLARCNKAWRRTVRSLPWPDLVCLGVAPTPSDVVLPLLQDFFNTRALRRLELTNGLQQLASVLPRLRSMPALEVLRLCASPAADVNVKQRARYLPQVLAAVQRIAKEEHTPVLRQLRVSGLVWGCDAVPVPLTAHVQLVLAALAASRPELEVDMEATLSTRPSVCPGVRRACTSCQVPRPSRMARNTSSHQVAAKAGAPASLAAGAHAGGSRSSRAAGDAVASSTAPGLEVELRLVTACTVTGCNMMVCSQPGCSRQCEARIACMPPHTFCAAHAHVSARGGGGTCALCGAWVCACFHRAPSRAVQVVACHWCGLQPCAACARRGDVLSYGTDATAFVNVPTCRSCFTSNPDCMAQ